MATSYKIEFTLSGPAVAQWMRDYLSPGPNRNTDAAARVIHANAYEGLVTWSLPGAEAPQSSIRLLAQAVQAFREYVPGGAELLKVHQSDIRVEILGGPR